jgi:LysM repeat protein
MKNKFVVIAGRGAVVCLAALLTGCATKTSEERLMMVRMQTDINGMQQEVQTLRGRVDAIEVMQEKTAGDVKRLGGQATGETEAMKKRLEEMQQDVSAMDAARERDKKEVVSKLSDKIVEVVDRQRPVFVSGNEYVVQSGDTLSGIASHYGVKREDIMKANGLSNPNLIRVGQKLIIPK